MFRISVRWSSITTEHLHTKYFKHWPDILNINETAGQFNFINGTSSFIYEFLKSRIRTAYLSFWQISFWLVFLWLFVCLNLFLFLYFFAFISSHNSNIFLYIDKTFYNITHNFASSKTNRMYMNAFWITKKNRILMKNNYSYVVLTV